MRAIGAILVISGLACAVLFRLLIESPAVTPRADGRTGEMYGLVVFVCPFVYLVCLGVLGAGVAVMLIRTK